jgi:hypothetical protein
VSSFRAPPGPGGLRPGVVPTFSVVIPAYQAADVVGDAITSALEQTAPPREVIVCDDGSTDGTAEVVAGFPGVTLVRKANGGRASALNAAISAATAEFIVPLDADDVYLPDRLRMLGVLAFERPDLDVLTTDAYFDVGGRVTGRFNELNPFPLDDQRSAALQMCFVVCPAIRQTRLAAIGGFDEGFTIAEDWDCLIRLVLSDALIGLVDEPLMRYRLREGSVSSERLSSLGARVAVFEKAVTDRRLTERELAMANRVLLAHRNELELAEIEAALLAGRRPRRRLIGVIGGQGYTPATRAKAAAALAFPGAAAKRLRERSSVRLVAPSARTWR